jgi:hypothetical protein
MLASDAVPPNTTGHAADAAALRLEAVMGQAIPSQNPAVVLRSHFNQLRALVAIALVAVAGLTVAVVILANESDEASTTSSAVTAESAGRASSEITRPPGSQAEFRGSKASADGTPGFARPGSEIEFRGSKASADRTPGFARPGSEIEFRGSKASADDTP